MTKPKKLNINDKIAVTAPSMPASPDAVRRGEAMLRALGLEPVMLPSCLGKGEGQPLSSEERAQEINDAFADENISGIICLRAGRGSWSVVELLDYDVIKAHPKIFVGFSDVTTIHLALGKKCGLITYHGPMATTSIYKKKKGRIKFDEYTYDSILRNLFTDEEPGEYVCPSDQPLRFIEGLSPSDIKKASGLITGGNLTILSESIGTDWEIDTAGRILFMEDMGETAGSVRDMLMNLKRAGKFCDCAGIILGTWVQCEDLCDDVFAEVLRDAAKPVIANYQAGHNVPQTVIPLGTGVTMDADTLSIVFS